MGSAISASPAPEKWALRFFPMWGGQAIWLVGSSIVQFALVWWMTASTGSATVLATASLIAILPQILVAPFSGALVDRWNRKGTMVVADRLIALAGYNNWDWWTHSLASVFSWAGWCSAPGADSRDAS